MWQTLFKIAGSLGLVLGLVIALAILGPTILVKPVPFYLELFTMGLAGGVRQQRESQLASSGHLNGWSLQQLERRYGKPMRRERDIVGFLISEGMLDHYELVVTLDKNGRAQGAEVTYVDDF